MRKSIFNIVIPFLLLSTVISLGSCKKNREVRAIITVLHDTVEPVGQDTAGLLIFDTITGPLTGAQVRMWSDQIGSLIDTTFDTNSDGKAEFEFNQVAILRMSVTFFSTEIDAGYVILEEGEVIEKTVNLDEF